MSKRVKVDFGIYDEKTQKITWVPIYGKSLRVPRKGEQP